MRRVAWRRRSANATRPKRARDASGYDPMGVTAARSARHSGARRRGSRTRRYASGSVSASITRRATASGPRWSAPPGGRRRTRPGCSRPAAALQPVRGDASTRIGGTTTRMSCSGRSGSPQGAGEHPVSCGRRTCGPSSTTASVGVSHPPAAPAAGAGARRHDAHPGAASRSGITTTRMACGRRSATPTTCGTNSSARPSRSSWSKSSSRDAPLRRSGQITGRGPSRLQRRRGASAAVGVCHSGPRLHPRRRWPCRDDPATTP